MEKEVKKLYLYVSKDKYELPEIVAYSMKELADTLGCKYSTVKSQLCRQRKGTVVTRFKEVDIELEENEKIEDFL